MDQIKHHPMLQTTEGSNGAFKKPDYLLLKKPTFLQFLLSLLSIFSLILSYSSSQIPAFSSLSFHLFTYTIDRNYLFLLCNGILVFLARNFEFFSTDQHQQYFHEKLTTGNVDQLWSKPEILEVDGYEEVLAKESTGSSETCDDELLVIRESGKGVVECLKEEYELMTTKDGEKDEENETLFTKDDEKEDAKILSVTKDEEKDERNEDEDEDDEEDGEGSLSIEELNKKCDDFIKKMKEVIIYG